MMMESERIIALREVLEIRSPKRKFRNIPGDA